jgi:hypothetical protein
MLKVRTAIAPAIIAVAALALTGCVGGAQDSQPSAEPAAAVTPTPTPIPGDTDGDGVLSEFEKQVLAKTSPRDYVLADGSTVLVDPALPLPAEVVADVKTKAAPWIRLGLSREQDADGYTPPAAGHENMYALLAETSELTGKSVAFVYEALSTDPSGWRDVFIAIGSNTQSMGITPGDAATVAAATSSWVEARDAELIVFE